MGGRGITLAAALSEPGVREGKKVVWRLKMLVKKVRKLPVPCGAHSLAGSGLQGRGLVLSSSGDLAPGLPGPARPFFRFPGSGVRGSDFRPLQRRKVTKAVSCVKGGKWSVGCCPRVC